MAFSDLASNQMVSYTDAQGGGFSLKAGQSNVTSNQCMTKDEALSKYNLSTANMSSYASNSLVPKSVWIPAASNNAPTTPDFLSYTNGNEFDFNGDGIDDYGWYWSVSSDDVGVTAYESILYKDGVQVDSKSSLNTYHLWNPDFWRTNYGTGTYCLKVRAGDIDGNWSAYTNTNCVVLAAVSDTTPPSTPTSLTPSLLSPTEIFLDWQASTDNVGVEGYEIYRSTVSSSSGFSIINTSATNSYYDPTVSPNTNYWYKVRAFDEAGNLSEFSNVVSQFTFN